jgi:hypothetical protein
MPAHSNLNKEAIDHMINEVNAMVDFCLSRGKKVPQNVMGDLQQLNELANPTKEQLNKFVSYHQMLSKRILPALPRNVVYIQEREDKISKSRKYWVVKIPAQRNLILFSLVSIIALVLSSTSEYVSPEDLAKGIMRSNGYPLLINFVFLCAAASIGSSFYILSNMKSRFIDGVYHPDQDTNDWVTIILGIIGGIILSQLIPIEISEEADQMVHLNRGVFALLGGFSSKFIYSILNRLIHTIESLFIGEQDNEKTKVATAQKEEAEDELNTMKVNLLTQNSELKAAISAENLPEERKKALLAIIDDGKENISDNPAN